jgi:hypothetical protein
VYSLTTHFPAIINCFDAEHAIFVKKKDKSAYAAPVETVELMAHLL